MVGQRRVHTFVRVDVDEHQYENKKQEIADGGGGHGAKLAEH